MATHGTMDTTNSPEELLSMPTESGFEPKHSITKDTIVLWDAQISQEAKDELSSLLEGDYNSIISKSPMEVGRTHLFSDGHHKHGTIHCM